MRRGRKRLGKCNQWDLNKRLKLINTKDDLTQTSQILCSHEHVHSLRGVVLGSLGIEGDQKESGYSMLIISNRFPAWLWNVGGLSGLD